MKVRWMLLFFWTIFHGILPGQSSSYQIKLEPLEVDQITGLQSYAVGTYDGLWIVMGGRRDGLHARQPFASFHPEGNHREILLIDPRKKKSEAVSIAPLDGILRDQLSSTNMSFYQKDSLLFIAGGYGYSEVYNEWITYPMLTVVDLSLLTRLVAKKEDISSAFAVFESEEMAVAGGRMHLIDSLFYLVGGHRFIGRYNPMGPDHGPGFSQEYTYEVRRFVFNFFGDKPIKFLPSFRDERHLRRRDYNLVPSVHGGVHDLIVFSGVFQKEVDLPWLYPVVINQNGIEEKTDFKQHFNHYHCPTLPIYDSSVDEMHHLFFGGIAQYYQEGDYVVQDNDVPFVKTITDVVRTEEGFEEIVLSSEMPLLLGAGAEFILNEEAPQYTDGILDGDLLEANYTLAGYVYGGIRSKEKNVFWSDPETESMASSKIYKVWIKKATKVQPAFSSIEESSLQFYTFPAQKIVRMIVEADSSTKIDFKIFDLEGNPIYITPVTQNLKKGPNVIIWQDVPTQYGSYLYIVNINGQLIKRIVSWSE